VSELVADGIPVAVTCRVLNLARQPYCRWRASPVAPAELAEARTGRTSSSTPTPTTRSFGSRYLANEAGEPVARRTAWRIWSTNWRFSGFCVKRKPGKGGKARPPGHDDLVQRDAAVADDQPVLLEDLVLGREQLLAEMVLRQQAPGVLPGRGVGHLRQSRPMNRRIAQDAHRVLRALVRQREPHLQQVHPQHHLHRLGPAAPLDRPAAVAVRLEQVAPPVPRDRLVHRLQQLLAAGGPPLLGVLDIGMPRRFTPAAPARPTWTPRGGQRFY
jgi:hypothetical protein